MSHNKYAFVLLLSLCCFTKPISGKAPAHARQKHLQIKENKLKKAIALIEDEYSKIFAAYELVEKAKPSEYAFYCDKLKKVLIEAVEEDNLGFKSTLSRVGYVFFQDPNDLRNNGFDALRKFKQCIAPKHIALLKNNRTKLKDSEDTKKADSLLKKLKGIKAIVS